MKTHRLFIPLFALLLLTNPFVSTLENTLAQTGNISSHSEGISTQPNGAPQSPEGPVYDVEPAPVHQWIALQAYLKLPSSDLKSELANYLPTDPNSPYYAGDYQGPGFVSPPGWSNSEDAPYEQSTSLIEGVWEEDNGEFFWGLGWLWAWRYFRHFWDPDGDYDAGFYVWWVAVECPSALEVAQIHFNQALACNIGDKTMAYYWLGRTAHLLMDLTVPAHAQLDAHPCRLGDCDSYEGFIASWEFHYKHITSSSPSTTPPSPPFTQYPGYTPSWFNDGLTNLFYELASNTDQFDSDDYDGDSPTYGNGKYRTASNTFDIDMSVDSICVFNIFFQRINKLSSPEDYSVVKCSWSHDASIIYTEAGRDKIKVLFSNGVRVYYAGGSHENFPDLDEHEVPWAVCGEIFQGQLQSRAIGYTAALYQLFWDICHAPPDDNYEENDDADHAYDLSGYWATWLHNIDGFGVHADPDWYEISVPAGIECLYIECRFVHSEGDIDIDLFNASEEFVASSNSSYRDIERICYDSPAPGTYYILVYQLPYNENTYDMWWGSDCTDKIALSSPPDGYSFPSCDPEIVVKWNLSDKVRRYEVEIDDNSDFLSPCYLVWTTTERDSAEVCAECGDLSPGQYYWRVRGETADPCALLGEWSDAWSFKVGCPELTIDSGSLTPANGSSGPRLVEFDWAALLDAAGYAFQIDTVSTAFNHLWCNEVILESHITRTFPLLVDQIYWRVKALGPGACGDGAWTSPCTYTDVEELDSPELPTKYTLSQNYPNPFNPNTKIEFTLARPGFVRLHIFDILGRKLRTLVSERLSAGYKSVVWDGKNEEGKEVSSGIYFYQLRAGALTETKRMLLLK